jgi:phosphate transport system permease protein
MRKLLDFVFAGVVALCGFIAVSLFAGLLVLLIERGSPAIRWAFFTESMRAAGAEGGVLWNITGTLILLATALLACAPTGVALALLEQVWLRGTRARRLLRTALYTLNGMPTIVLGIFGFIVFVQWCGWGKSWLAGGLVLALSMLPTVAVSLIERLESIPARYVEAAAGLGLSKTQIVWAVLLPQAWSGLFSGSLLGLARAAGETAPIMFTATIFAGATFPTGIKDSPVLSLPYHIFILAQDSFDPAVGSQLWGAALVLVALVMTLSLIALPFRMRTHEEAHA